MRRLRCVAADMPSVACESVGLPAQDVGVVQVPVDGGGRDALGHELVEPGRVDVGRDRNRAFLRGGVDHAEQHFCRVG